MNIAFFPVHEVPSKLRKIVEVATIHFEKKESLCILVPDQAAYEFVDQLLWRLPEEGFLPHPSSLILIDTDPKEASALFNLRPIPYQEKISFKTIYEFEDHTSAEKFQLSKQRYTAYREANLPISYL
jgi:DNA polymerase IIIc chi subunit